MPDTVMGVPYPLPGAPVRDGAAAMLALAHAVPAVQSATSAAAKDVRIYASHAGFTTNVFGQFVVTPTPNLSTILFAAAHHISTTALSDQFIVTPYYGGTFGVGPAMMFNVRTAGQPSGWIVNTFLVCHVLIIGV